MGMTMRSVVSHSRVFAGLEYNSVPQPKRGQHVLTLSKRIFPRCYVRAYIAFVARNPFEYSC